MLLYGDSSNHVPVINYFCSLLLRFIFLLLSILITPYEFPKGGSDNDKGSVDGSDIYGYGDLGPLSVRLSWQYMQCRHRSWIELQSSNFHPLFNVADVHMDLYRQSIGLLPDCIRASKGNGKVISSNIGSSRGRPWVAYWVALRYRLCSNNSVLLCHQDWDSSW